MRTFASGASASIPFDRLGGGTTLEVATSRPIAYTIANVPRAVFDPGSSYVARFTGDRQTFAVVDENVMRQYGPSIVRYLTERTNFAGCISMPGTEDAKSVRTVRRIFASAMEHRIDRSAVMVAVGGGVVMDVVGLTASLYRRGIDYLRIPTTLIGIVDVAVGIKTAINFLNKKNVLGAFHPPLGAIADRRFLKTLDLRHLACGLAEIVKMGIVCDPILFDLTERYACELLSSGFSQPDDVPDEIILRAQSSMIGELEPNLFERDKRRLVDFGHTVSPALEAASSYRMHHGEAVAVDMLFSSALGTVQGVCDRSVFSRLRALYERINLPVRSEQFTGTLAWRAFEEARKHRDGSLNLVVPTRIGSATFVQQVTNNELIAALTLMR